MRALALAAPFVLGVTALPRGQLERPYENTVRTWSSAFHNAWETLRDSTIGWYSTDIYDQLEGVIRAPDQSVLQWLESNSNFSNITKLIKYDKEITELLDEASHGLTFLAPNNKALSPPNKHERKHIHEVQVNDRDVLSQFLLHGDEIFAATGDDKDEKKKKMFKGRLNAILRYHILPYDISSTSLGTNSTVQTNLIPKDGSYNGQNRRIKIEKTLVPPSILINKYATIVSGDNKATNGYIHEIDHPLLPPPSILTLAHMFPQHLSTSTSAIQKVGLDDALDWHYVHKDSSLTKPTFEGTPTVTAFLPTNEAWKKLPKRLVLYLFSPVGAKVLTKLLQFHTVPRYIIHSEWIYNGDDKKKDDLKDLGVEIDLSYDFPTGLKNFTLPVHIVKTTPTLPVPGIAYFDFKVLGQKIDGPNLDIPARNGAFHIVESVLNPHKVRDHGDDKHKHHRDVNGDDGWEDWEDWLPQLGQEE